MDLNRLINEGDPIVDENLTHAKGVVKALEGFRGTSHCFMILYTTNQYDIYAGMGEDPVVTEEIVQSAELRVWALEHIRVSLFLLLY